MFRNSKTVVLGISLAFLMSCSTIYRNHGYTPPEDELSNIIVGIDTRASVEDALGVPTTGGVSNSDGMYYVSSRWRHFGAMAPKPVSREIVGVTFDANGVVQNISRYGLEDGEVVVLSRRVTAGGAREISFIRQLMGNFGRFDASTILGE